MVATVRGGGRPVPQWPVLYTECALVLSLTRYKRSITIDNADAFRLQAEIRDILEAMRLLKEKLNAALQSMARLQKTKVTLENDIAIKESSIDIDRRECIGLRKTVAIDPTRGGANFSMTLTGF